MKEYARETTADRDILNRRWLPLDFDAVRPAGISSTNVEHEAALDRAQQCREWLRSQGWPEPIFADSGNGAHLLYRVGLPTADSRSIELCLKALAAKFDDSTVVVDVGNYNPSRIWEFYGTLVAKGDSVPERPHRLARILEAPRVIPVSDQQLAALTLMVLEAPKPERREYREEGQPFDLDRWIVDHGLCLAVEKPWDGGRLNVLEVCPFNTDHADRSAVITQSGDGAIGFKCHHNSCEGKHWRDVRALLEPEVYQGPSPMEVALGQAEQEINRNTPEGRPAYRLRVHDVADIDPKPVQWLWPKRLPLGKLCLLAGDPGLGKSYLTLYFAARVSLGGPWPDHSSDAPRGNVLISSVKDGMADTIRPRLGALGADLSMIRIVEAIVESDADNRALSLVDNLQLLEREIIGSDTALLILDPILAFTGVKDTHRASDVRAVLGLLAAMAKVTGCTILAVMHLNKRSGEFNSIYRITGSGDFAATARSVMVLGKHPEIEGRRVFAPVKMNLSAMPESLECDFTDDGVFRWVGTSTLEAIDLLSTPSPEENGARQKQKNSCLTS